MSTKHNCPACGSEDNLVEFDNGTSYCFTPACTSNDNRQSRIRVDPRPLPRRGITEATCAKYGVGFGEDGHLWSPYYKDGHVTAYKVRKPDKVFYWVGNASKATLFGLQACSGDRRLIIVEGELDALAAYQMTGYPAVSIRNASTAVADIKANLEFIESYEYVYVCTDMDVPGRKAAQQIMELLKPGKAYLMNLPEGYKDSCDMLSKGMGREFKQCLFAARPINVDGVISDEVLRSKALELFTNETKRRGVSTLIPSLDYLLGGFRPGEVTLIAGGTGVGKTALVRQLAVNLASQQLPVFFIPLEMNPEVVLLQMAEMVLHGNVFTNPEFSVQKIEQTILTLTESVKFFDHFGTMDPVKLINTIEYVCRVHDIKYVVLDHISAVVNGGDDERRGIDQAIAGLKSVALRLGLHIIVVSHISRSKDDPDDNNPTLSKIRHSAGLAQYSDQVLGVRRARSENQTEIKTLKVSRLWGQYGTANLEWVDYHFQEKTNNNKNGKNGVPILTFDDGTAGVGGDHSAPALTINGGQVTSDNGIIDLGRSDGVPVLQVGDNYDDYISLDAVWGPGPDDGGPGDNKEQEGYPQIEDGPSFVSVDLHSFSTGDGQHNIRNGGLVNEESSGKQAEEGREAGRVRLRPRESGVLRQRTDAAQQSEGSLCAETIDVHPRLSVDTTKQNSYGGNQRAPNGIGTDQVQSSAGQLPTDSGVPGEKRGRTRFRLSERGWSFEPQEPE